MSYKNNATFLRQQIEQSRQKILDIRQGRIVGNLQKEELRLSILMDDYKKFFSHLN